MQAGLEPYIPYKGNKFQILDNIWNTIRGMNIDIKGFVDPFCGGGSFSYWAAYEGYPVIASDFDESVVELHNAMKYCPELVRSWKSQFFNKEEFKKFLDVQTAYGAFVRQVWSFSNDGRTYLTSTEKEQDMFERFSKGVAEPNSRFKHLEDVLLLWAYHPNIQLQFLHRSFEEVEVPEGYVAYCDPPYANTDGYRVGAFDHNKFYEWALKQKGLVLISEYSMPEDFTLVDVYLKSVESARGANSVGKKEEKLFANQPVKKLTLF